MTAAEFAERLAASGLVPRAEAEIAIRGFCDHNADAESSAHDLAKELVHQHRLTMFQVSALFLNRPKELVFGPFEIVDKLAASMGEVYKGVDRRTHTPVVIKLLPAKKAEDAELVQRFNREVRLLLRLRHPNIVHAIDAGEQSGTHYLIMEYVDGGDLSRIVKVRGVLTLARAVDYILQAARGLEYAHDQGVVHRDIKPSNLVVDAHGVVKVLDLGLARLLDGDDPLTQTGSVMGSIDFMAPEQSFDSKVVDHRVDLYSLGCTLYYLLTGRVLFDDRSLMQKVLAHRQEPAPTVRASRPETPPALDAIIHRLLAKRPNDRIPTMQHLIDELEAIAPNLPEEHATVVAEPRSSTRIRQRLPGTEPLEVSHTPRTINPRIPTPPQAVGRATAPTAPMTRDPTPRLMSSATQQPIQMRHKVKTEPPAPLRPLTPKEANAAEWFDYAPPASGWIGRRPWVVAALGLALCVAGLFYTLRIQR